MSTINPWGNTVINANVSLGVGGTGTVQIGNATGNTTIPAGNLSLTAGNINIPTSTAATAGFITQASVPFIHSYSPVSPSHNLFMGTNAGTTTDMTIECNDNTGIGYNALVVLHGAGGGDASFNTGIGSHALTAVTEGNNNTAVGYFSGKTIDTGVDNTMVGASAGVLIEDGNENTAIGSGALQNVTTGTNNIGIGYEAGTNLETTNNNICIGAAGNIADSGVIRIGTAQTEVILSGTIFAGADSGAGIATYTGMTNGSQSTTSGVNTLVGTALGGGGKPNDGYLKFYLGTQAVYIPYWKTP